MTNKERKAPMPFDLSATQDVMMFTSDIALVKDDNYTVISHLYAGDMNTLEHDFAHSWYKLMSRDMGPISRCIDKGDLPAALPWQKPLPPSPAQLANFDSVKRDVRDVLDMSSTDPVDFVFAAYQSANSFRITDYRGGANGATIMHSPQKDWPSNAGVEATIASLTSIKNKYGASLSWADLIVLAGSTALESRGGEHVPFCGVRTDASSALSDEAAQGLEPWAAKDLLADGILSQARAA